MGRHVRYRLSDVLDWETERFDENPCDHDDPGTLTNQAPEQVADTPSPDARFGRTANLR